MSTLLSPPQLAADEDQSLVTAENIDGASLPAPLYPRSLAPSIAPSHVPSVASVAFSRISRFPSIATSLAASSMVRSRSYESLPSYDPVRVSISSSAPRRSSLRWADLEMSAPVYTVDAGLAPPARKHFDIKRANSVPPHCPPPVYKRRKRDVMLEWGRKVVKDIKGIGGGKVKSVNV